MGLHVAHMDAINYEGDAGISYATNYEFYRKIANRVYQELIDAKQIESPSSV